MLMYNMMVALLFVIVYIVCVGLGIVINPESDVDRLSKLLDSHRRALSIVHDLIELERHGVNIGQLDALTSNLDGALCLIVGRDNKRGGSVYASFAKLLGLDVLLDMPEDVGLIEGDQYYLSNEVFTVFVLSNANKDRGPTYYRFDFNLKPETLSYAESFLRESADNARKSLLDLEEI